MFDEFKKLADKKKEVYDATSPALIEKRMTVVEEQWNLVAYEVHAKGTTEPTVAVTLRHGDDDFTVTTTGGDGPLDALFHTIEQITDIPVTVRDFRVYSVTSGKDAQGESTIEVEYQGCRYRDGACPPTPSRRPRWRSSTRSTALPRAAANRSTPSARCDAV